jgi:hypothetical protein
LKYAAKDTELELVATGELLLIRILKFSPAVVFGKEKFNVAGDVLTAPGLEVNIIVDSVKSPLASDNSIVNWFDEFKFDSGEKAKVVL